MKLKQYFGDKKFYKFTFSIILPIMIQQLFLSIAGYIDSLMINGYDAEHLAFNGVSAANRLIVILSFVWLGCATTASIFLSQYFGAKKKEKMQETFRLSIYVAIFIGVLSMGIVFFFGKNVVNTFVINPISRQYGYDYLKWFIWGICITSINYAFASAFRSIEKPKVALYCSILGIIVNVILNYLLIFGHFHFPRLGAEGAAIATVISRVFETLCFILTIVFSKTNFFKGSFKQWKVNKKLILSYLKKGIPLVMNELLFSLGLVIFAKYYTYKNDMWYNAYSYSQNISELFFIIFNGLGTGTGVILGASLGENSFEKAKQDAKKLKMLGILLGLGAGILMASTSSFVVQFFHPTLEVKKIVIHILLATSVFIWIYSYNSVNFFILRSGGDSVRAFILDQTPTYFISIPLTIILGINAVQLNLRIEHIFLISHIADVIKIFLGNYFVKMEKWVVNLTLSSKKVAIDVE